jgi:hypothetical protein
LVFWGQWVKAERHQSVFGVKIQAMNLADGDEVVGLHKENELLQIGCEIIGRCLICQRTRVRYGFIQGQQKTYSVTLR